MQFISHQFVFHRDSTEFLDDHKGSQLSIVTFGTPSSYDKVCSLSIYSKSNKMFGKERVALLLSELIKDWPCTVQGGEIRTSCHGNYGEFMTMKKGFIFVARKGGHNDGALIFKMRLPKVRSDSH